MKKEKFFDVYDWIPIKDFDNQIYLKNGESLQVLEIKPINFKLKSDLEQTAILEAYKRFLKQCDFDIQIIVLAYKTDVSKHLEEVDKYYTEDSKLSQMTKCYKELITQIVGDKRSFTRRFFIIFKKKKDYEESINKIVSTLEACGNEVSACKEDVICKIFECFFRRENV